MFNHLSLQSTSTSVQSCDGEKNSGVKEMLSAMKADMSDEQMKASLMNVLEQRVQHKDSK